jgi:hypothetical protein
LIVCERGDLDDLRGVCSPGVHERVQARVVIDVVPPACKNHLDAEPCGLAQNFLDDSEHLGSAPRGETDRVELVENENGAPSGRCACERDKGRCRQVERLPELPRRADIHERVEPERERGPSPSNQHLTCPLEPTPTDELGQRSRRRVRAPTRQAGQAGEHGVRFLEPDILELAAVAGVPAKRRTPKALRVVDQEEY